ncbi:MAG: hypothetical protein D6796_08995, partial [Caldilineae bacterium]
FRLYLPLVSNASPGPAVMFQMPYLRHTFDYYFAGAYRPLEGVWSNNNRPAAEVEAEMRRRTAGLRSLWLVVSEEDYWDRRHLTRDWLNRHATLTDEAHFTGVDVYRYTFEREG